MDLIQAIVLGIIQGLTEWLPISSSGHLVIAHYFFDIPFSPEFDIALMAGTSLALILYFRKKIAWILKGLVAFEKPQLHYIALIILAGIPTILIGFPFKDFFKSFFSQPLAVSVFIFITGLFLFVATKVGKPTEQLGPKQAVLMGIAQGIAVMPGISRSGSTIGTGVLFGLRAEDAAEFSFLIGVPAMVAASAIDFVSSGVTLPALDIVAVGVITSFIAGYASIGFFMSLLRQHKLRYFAYYCLIAGTVFFLGILLLR